MTTNSHRLLPHAPQRYSRKERQGIRLWAEPDGATLGARFLSYCRLLPPREIPKSCERR